MVLDMSALFFLIACGGDRITLVVPLDALQVFESFANHTTAQDLTVTASKDPESDASGRGLQVAMAQDRSTSDIGERAEGAA